MKRAALAVALVVAPSSAAAAELRDEADTVVEAYRAAGARAERVATAFLFRGDSRALAIPVPKDARCLRVVALAERPLAFTLQSSSAVGGEGRVARESSAGVAELEHCALASGVPNPLSRVFLAMSSRRGAVEVLAIAHDGDAPELDEVLPGRSIGPVAPEAEIGAPLALSPLAARTERSSAAARRDGAAIVVPIDTRSTDKGAGALILNLTRGCHRLSVLADDDPATTHVDVDAEVRLQGADEALRLDRSHAPDARLEFCLGETRKVELRFAGAGGERRVRLLDAYFPPPDEGVPSHWGTRERAGLYGALFKRRAPRPVELPVNEWIGGPGATVLPLPVEGRACYLAALAFAAGDVAVARLLVEVDGRSHHDDAFEEPAGAAVTFCTGSSEHARAEIDVHARSGFWRLALWQLGGVVP